MEDILSKAIVEKLDTQATQIMEMQSTVKKVSDQHHHLQHDITKVKATLNSISFPTEQIEQLTLTLSVFQKQVHQLLQTSDGHFRLIIKFWFAIAVLALGIFYTGRQWYLAHLELTDYKASDTKYRYLKLQANPQLKELLLLTDSLYRADPGMRDSVLWREQVVREQRELQQLIKIKENELMKLKEAASE
jgi:hypothetical protein